MTSLKAVNIGQNKFCGPAVLSILTGKSTDDCAYAITRVNGQYKVTGVLLSDLIKAADSLGFKLERVGISGSSLYMVLVQLSTAGDAKYVITVSNHYITIEVKDKQIYLCDNHTKEPISATSSARLGQMVIDVSRVIEKPKPKLLEADYKTVILTECNYCKQRSEAISFSLYKHSITCPYRTAIEANRD